MQMDIDIANKLLFQEIERKPRIMETHLSPSYSVLIKAMEDENQPLFLQTLEEINLDTMNYTSRINLLTRLVTKIKELDKPDFLEPVLEKWSPEGSDLVLVIGDLFSYAGCDLETLSFICGALDTTVIPVEILESQLEQTNGLSLGFVMERINRIFKDQAIGSDEFNFLLEQAKRLNHKSAIHWLEQQIASKVTFAKIPEWVSLKPDESPELLEVGFWSSVRTPEPTLAPELVKGIYTVTDKEGKVVEKDSLLQLFETAQRLTRVNADSYPANPNRVFGPLNARTSPCITQVVSDGCRMFTCMCREFDQQDDREPDLESVTPYTWFTGVCDGCNLRIRNLSHSLRYPIVGGGWVGCFCSIDCLKSSRPRDTNQMTELILDSTFATIEENGIMDQNKFKPTEEPSKKPKSLYLAAQPLSMIPSIFKELSEEVVCK